MSDKRVKQEAFLAAYRRSGIVTVAAREAGVHRNSYYQWLSSDPWFAKAAADAEAEAVEEVEAELRRRALDPTKRDTVALIFYLKAHRPQKYRDNVTIRHEGTLAPEVKEALAALAEAAKRKRR